MNKIAKHQSYKQLHSKVKDMKSETLEEMARVLLQIIEKFDLKGYTEVEDVYSVIAEQLERREVEILDLLKQISIIKQGRPNEKR